MASIIEVGDNVVLFLGGLAFLHGAELVEHVLLHLLLGYLGDCDVIVRQAVSLGDVEIEFGRKAKVELEGEILAGLPLVLGLVLAGEGLSEHMEVIFLDNLVELLVDHRIDALHESLLPVKFLDQGHRSLSFAESLEFGVPETFVELLLLDGRIVFGGDFQGDLEIEVVNLILLYIHLVVLDFSEKSAKVIK